MFAGIMLKMQSPSLHFESQWLLKDIDRMIRLISGGVRAKPGESQGEVVDSDAFVSAFARLTHKSSCNLTEKELHKKGIDLPTSEGIFGDGYFDRANLDQIRLFLFYCARAERFVEGYITEQVRNGRMLTALRRLEVLRKSPQVLLLEDFLKLTKLAKMPISQNDFFVRFDPLEHEVSLQKGTAACYVFTGQHGCLKVGQVGTNSNARFKFHHYKVSGGIGSSLARSILKSDLAELGFEGATEANIGEFIRERTERTNFYLRVEPLKKRWGNKAPSFLLNLLEGFLQCRLKPRFEGRVLSQAE